MDNRNLGPLGEDKLRGWCHEEGIIINKAEEDLGGWDFILEFPLKIAFQNISTSLDKSPFPLRCFIQVKSTDQTLNSMPIKLDNWAMYIKNPLPVFFLVLEFNGKKTCQSAFLIHVDNYYIEQVLKRLRETSINNKPLHKQFLQFQYNNSHKLQSLDGEGLVKAIYNHINVSPEEYATNKIRMLKESKYDSDSSIISFSIKPPSQNNLDIKEYISNFLIGLIPEIPVIMDDFQETRFGITLTKEIDENIREGVLSIEYIDKPKGSIKLITSDKKHEYLLNTDIILPGIESKSIEDKYLKIRFSMPFLDIILSPFNNSAKIIPGNLDISETYNLSSLTYMSNFFIFIHDSSASERPVLFEARIEQKLICSGYINYDNQFSEIEENFYRCISLANALASFFNLDKNLNIRIDRLLNQYEKLILLSANLGFKTTFYRVTFFLENNILELEKDHFVPFPIVIFLGEYLLIIGGCIVGKPEQINFSEDKGFQYIINSTTYRIFRKSILYKEDINKISMDQIKEDIMQYIDEEFGSDAQIINIDNF